MGNIEDRKIDNGSLTASEVENLSVEVGKVKILGTPENYISTDNILSLMIDYAHQQNITTQEVLRRLAQRLDEGNISKPKSQPTILNVLPFLRHLTKPA